MTNAGEQDRHRKREIKISLFSGDGSICKRPKRPLQLVNILSKVQDIKLSPRINWSLEQDCGCIYKFVHLSTPNFWQGSQQVHWKEDRSSTTGVGQADGITWISVPISHPAQNSTPTWSRTSDKIWYLAQMRRQKGLHLNVLTQKWTLSKPW